jgi:hypothetical protein
MNNVFNLGAFTDELSSLMGVLYYGILLSGQRIDGEQKFVCETFTLEANNQWTMASKMLYMASFFGSFGAKSLSCGRKFAFSIIGNPNSPLADKLLEMNNGCSILGLSRMNYQAWWALYTMVFCWVDKGLMGSKSLSVKPSHLRPTINEQWPPKCFTWHHFLGVSVPRVCHVGESLPSILMETQTLL